jgi:hypothetical protein
MTRLELENLIAVWLNDPNKTFFTATQIQSRINLAQKVLQSILIDSYQDRYTVCVTSATIANTGRYLLPSDFRKIRRLEILTSGSGDTATYKKIEPMDLNQQDLLSPGAGTPSRYFLVRNHMYLRQVPAQVWTMHMNYVYTVADLTTDGQTPDIPAEYHEFLAVLSVRADLVQDGVDMTAILELKKEYEEKIRMDAANRKPDGARMITATRDGYGSMP